jgi:hypothetical protein
VGQFQHGMQHQQPAYPVNPGAYNQQAMKSIGTQQPRQQQPPYQQQRPPYQQPQQAQGGYSFRQQGSVVRPGTQQQQQSGGRANLNNLRAQLLSTLQKNKQNKS